MTVGMGLSPARRCCMTTTVHGDFPNGIGFHGGGIVLDSRAIRPLDSPAKTPERQTPRARRFVGGPFVCETARPMRKGGSGRMLGAGITRSEARRPDRL